MSLVDEVWDAEIVPALTEYIRIPNLSVAFDPEWSAHGHMAEAVDLVRRWAEQRPIAGLTVEVVELPGLTPVLVCEVPAFGGGPSDDTVLLYGHLDKQPEMTGWREGLGPWTPVLEGDRLYGRGGADDGYAAFASLTAIQAVQDAGLPHARCVVLIEATEESGSLHLPPYVDLLADRIGEPSLVVCLDASCATWDRLWVTTSLRGVANLFVDVQVLTEGLHSGIGGGIVPDTFRVLRALLSRIEDEETGELLLPALRADVPPERRQQVEETAEELGDALLDWPWVPGAGPVGDTPAERMLAKTWKGALAVVGADGLPPTNAAGNVLRPSTRVKLSIRLPPTTDAAGAVAAVTEALTTDPPYGAAVSVELEAAESGWGAPTTAPWLAEAIDRGSRAAFGQPARYFGEGGTIPFLGMLGERFPNAQFLTTGVLGPGTNAHGPNEYLHVPTGKRVTEVVVEVLAGHARRGDGS